MTEERESFINKQDFTGLKYKVVVIFIATSFYFFGIYLLTKVAPESIASFLSKATWAVSIFLVAEWQVRTKQNDITADADEKFSAKEQRRINATISARHKRSTYKLIYFVALGALLFFSPFLLKITEIKSLVIPVCFISFGVAIGFTLINYILYLEVENFKRQLETRIAKRKRRHVHLEALKPKDKVVQ